MRETQELTGPFPEITQMRVGAQSSTGQSDLVSYLNPPALPRPTGPQSHTRKQQLPGPLCSQPHQPLPAVTLTPGLQSPWHSTYSGSPKTSLPLPLPLAESLPSPSQHRALCCQHHHEDQHKLAPALLCAFLSHLDTPPSTDSILSPALQSTGLTVFHLSLL